LNVDGYKYHPVPRNPPDGVKTLNEIKRGMLDSFKYASDVYWISIVKYVKVKAKDKYDE